MNKQVITLSDRAASRVKEIIAQAIENGEEAIKYLNDAKEKFFDASSACAVSGKCSSLLDKRNYLESCWAPINKLNGSFGFNCRNSGVYILWYNVTSVEHTASHIFS